MIEIDEEKTAFNARAKASMREYLRAKTWVEKVKSMERMNVADRIAKEAMRKARAADEFEVSQGNRPVPPEAERQA